MTHTPTPFSDAIRQHRKRLGLTMQAVANAAGLTKTHVWELEQGKRVNPTVQTLIGLAEVYQVAPATLLRAAIEQMKERTNAR